MNNMKKNYTNLILITSIFITLITVVVFVYLFKIIANKNEHTSAVLMTLSSKMSDKKNAEILLSKLTELSAINENIDNYFVDSAKIDKFVGYLEQIGIDNDTKLSVKNIELLPKKRDTISVKVSMNGDFDNVMKAIYTLENIPYHVTLNQSFISKEIKTMESVEMDENSEIKNNTKRQYFTWNAEVSFNVLSLQ